MPPKTPNVRREIEIRTSDPTSTDDSTTGILEGTLWVNTSTDTYFVCADATPSAAVWQRGAIAIAGASIDNRITRFDGVGGHKIQNSLVAIDDTGNVLPPAAGQSLGLTAAANRWKRLFAEHTVSGVDAFAATNTLDDARYVIAQDGTYTLTLPTADVGWGYVIERKGSTGIVTIAPGGGDTINGNANYVMLPDSVNYLFAENANDWRLFHLMTVADKVKLDGLSPAGSVLAATFFSSATVSSMSGTYMDAFFGNSINPPSDGDYRVIFSGEYTGSNGNTAVEVGVGKNVTNAAQTGSERKVTPPSANKTNTFFTDVVLTGLVQADAINGIFLRSSGSGNALLKRRRITLEKVTV